MKENKYSWNETLKFSWGHIIAFVALIFLNYVMYMGCFYSNGGDFAKAALYVVLIDFVILTTFIGAQILKGADRRFNRSIIMERVLICLCPIAFLCGMIPYNHFWNVLDEGQQIEEQFNMSINGAKQMFVEYDEYAETRIEMYDSVLNSIMTNSGTIDQTSKDNYIKTLKLQLLSQNTDNLKFLATKWIDDANSGASVWNAFLIGNVKQISNAINSWNETLRLCSANVLSNENLYGNDVSLYEGSSYQQSIDGINNLTNIYVNTSGININTVWTGVLLFIMFLFPYILQKRNTRATGLYFLIPVAFRTKKAVRTKSDNLENIEVRIEHNVDDGNLVEDNSSGDIYGGTF